MNETYQQEVNAMRFSQAVEQWTYCDSVVINANLATFPQYNGAGWFASYPQMALQREIPFFKTRNQAMVGSMFCNMDLKDRFSVPFHLFSIGIEFIIPGTANQAAPSQQLSNAIFAGEIPRHTGFEFRVGQDEKIAIAPNMAPGGAGVTGSVDQLDNGTVGSFNFTHIINNGNTHCMNHYELKERIEIPRGETVEGKLVLTPNAQNFLNACTNPGFNEGDAENPGEFIWQTAIIRVSLYGVRETQFRNLQHF